jgi:hypothetical protein
MYGLMSSWAARTESRVRGRQFEGSAIFVVGRKELRLIRLSQRLR